jgi:hypothetical protein
MTQPEIKNKIILHIKKRDQIKNFLSGNTDLQVSDVVKLKAKIKEHDFLISESKDGTCTNCYDNGIWVDPAGGVHHEEADSNYDPAAMYE